MAMHPKDTGAHIKTLHGSVSQDSSGDPKIVTAGATEDGVKVTGTAVDRLGYMSIELAIIALAVLADTKSLSFAVELQESADNSSWDTAEVIQASTIAVTSDGGTTESVLENFAVNLDGRKRYIRFNITPDLSATGTDIAIWAAVVAMGGADVLPAA